MQNWWECEWTHTHLQNLYARADFKIVFLSLFRDNLATFCSTAVLQFFALSSACTYLGPSFPLLMRESNSYTHSNVFLGISQWKLNSFYSQQFLGILTSPDKHPFHSMGKNMSVPLGKIMETPTFTRPLTRRSSSGTAQGIRVLLYSSHPFFHTLCKSV